MISFLKLLNNVILCFVLNELNPHPAGIGKELYFLCDVGLSSHLGASFEKQVWTCALNELLAKSWFVDTRETNLFYFRSRGGGFVHLVEENESKLSGLKIHPEEGVRDQDLRILRSFREKTSPTTKLFLLGSSNQKWPGITGLSWEAIAS